jgi:hypothetical protein
MAAEPYAATYKDIKTVGETRAARPDVVADDRIRLTTLPK